MPEPAAAITGDRRARLAACVAQLATAIATGDVTPQVVELQALASICEDAGLQSEAWRIRRWLEGTNA